MNDKEEYIYTYEELLDLVIKYQKENKELSRMCEIYSKSLYNSDLKKLQSNWNSLRGYTKAHIEIIENKLSLIGTCNPVIATKELQIYQQYLDKMNELEGVDNESN